MPQGMRPTLDGGDEVSSHLLHSPSLTRLFRLLTSMGLVVSAAFLNPSDQTSADVLDPRPLSAATPLNDIRTARTSVVRLDSHSGSEVHPDDYVHDEILVKFKEEPSLQTSEMGGVTLVGKPDTVELQRKYHVISVTRVLGLENASAEGGVYLLKFDDGTDTLQARSDYQALEGVEWVDLN